MMSETMTLGERMRRHIAEWVDDAPMLLPRGLGEICAYADACERLARAADAASESWERYVRARPLSAEERSYSGAYKEHNDLYFAALAAYRAEVTRG